MEGLTVYPSDFPDPEGENVYRRFEVPARPFEVSALFCESSPSWKSLYSRPLLYQQTIVSSWEF